MSKVLWLLSYIALGSAQDCPEGTFNCPFAGGQICVPNKSWARDRYGAECPPPGCPMGCGEDQMSCWGGYNYNGCPMPDTCMPKPNPMPTDTCPPAGCPLRCGPDEMVCSRKMPWSDCPEDYCMSKRSTNHLNFSEIAIN